MRLMMMDVRNAIAGILDNRTLAEMRNLSDADRQTLMYHI